MRITMDIHTNWVRVSSVLSVEVKGFVGLVVMRENDFFLLNVGLIFGIDFVVVSISLVDRVVIKYFGVLDVVVSIFVVFVTICKDFVKIFGKTVTVFVEMVDFSDDFEVFFANGTLITIDLLVVENVLRLVLAIVVVLILFLMLVLVTTADVLAVLAEVELVEVGR